MVGVALENVAFDIVDKGETDILVISVNYEEYVKRISMYYLLSDDSLWTQNPPPHILGIFVV